VSSTATNRRPVLFRCDASPEIGLGHLVRCLALADELRQNHGAAVAFAMRTSPLGSEMVKRRGYLVLSAPDCDGVHFDYEAWLHDCMRQTEAQALFVDVRDDLPRSALDALALRGATIAVVEDLSERRWAAHLAFYPPVPQVQMADWSGFQGRLCVGWQWVILRSQFAGSLLPRDHSFLRRDRSTIFLLIAMGGSDPAGLTLKAVRAVDRLEGDFESVIILGSAFCHRASLQSILGNARRRFTVREDVREMSAAMAEADLAICSFGMTAYELAAMGVPTVYVCLTEDHEKSASALVAAGMGTSAGVDDQETEIRLSVAVARLLIDKKARSQMSVRARELIDGQGANRIAELLVGAVARH
jgi:spore coat polysaccharide biosynthesis predicted glycosyltransferase SpsG